MKKFLILLLVLTLCGCAAPATPSTEPTTEPTVETTEATEPTQPKIIGYDLDIPEGFEIKTSEDDRAIYLTEEEEERELKPWENGYVNKD